MKIKKIPIIFSLFTFPVSYIAFAMGLGGGLILSVNNIIYILIQASILALITFFLLLKPKQNKTKIYFGIFIEIIIYCCTWVYTAIVATI